MARFSFPSLRKGSDEPATPRRSEGSADGLGLRAPCDFMPQSPAPMMVMSPATPRTHKGADDRALRLLQPYPDYNGNGQDDTDGEKLDACKDFDINKPPKTPPQTPVTPTTDASMSSARSKISITVFTDIFLYMRITGRVLLLIIVIVFELMLLVLVCQTFCGAIKGVTQVLPALLQGLQFASNAVEIGIEGTGWITEKAVGRFAKGFVRGYMM